uniref:DAZ-associated protein 1 n=1 Tax=Schistocephalus solidus TaxID=70667 RepID=A0A0X3NRL5_SCHSO
MAVDEAECGICSESPIDQRTTSCSHTFRVSPANSNQTAILCAFGGTKIDVTDPEPGTSATSASQEMAAVSPECKSSAPEPEVCEDSLEKVRPVPEVFDVVMAKLADLTSRRLFIESLKSTLCRIRDDSVSCKESLLADVRAADNQLYYPAFYSLEKVKLFVASTYEEEFTRLKKLQRNVLRLRRRWVELLQTTSNIIEEIKPTTLKEMEQSSRKLLVKDIQKSAELCECSGFDNVTSVHNFDSVQLQLQKFFLVTSDCKNVCDQLTLLPIEAHASRPEDQNPTEANWELDPSKICIKRLPEATKECDLHAYFSKFGLIAEVYVPRKKMGPTSFRCGFVIFLETDSVRKVLEAQPHQLDGNHVVTCVARKKHSKDSESLCTRFPAADRRDDDLSQSEDDRPSHNASDIASNQPTIFVGHLKQEVTNFELKTYFCQFGRVSKAKVVHNWATGESRGYGFVTFADSKAFKRSVLEVCHFLHGSRLSVQHSINRI